MNESPYFSIIVPIYNRPNEVTDLLASLAEQESTDFEVVLVEDGSTVPSEDAVNKYSDKVNIQYFQKSNEGRSIARNYGLERARGEYFIFFDSDCVIPPGYFTALIKSLKEHYTDSFGGPDAAHSSFNDVQKAINFSMTAFLTTGGIRGGKVQLEKFTPRTFNMGFSREVYNKVGGFREMFSEDIDMSTRIRKAGFNISLIREAFVYHKRRSSLKLFRKQVWVFGMSRVTLYLLYPESLKAVHLLPSVFLVGCIALILLSIFCNWLWILPLVAYFSAIFITSLISNKSLKIAALSIITSIIQLGVYGAGFIKAWTWKILLRHGRNINEEVAIRKGK